MELTSLDSYSHPLIMLFEGACSSLSSVHFSSKASSESWMMIFWGNWEPLYLCFLSGIWSSHVTSGKSRLPTLPMTYMREFDPSF